MSNESRNEVEEGLEEEMEAETAGGGNREEEQCVNESQFGILVQPSCTHQNIMVFVFTWKLPPEFSPRPIYKSTLHSITLSTYLQHPLMAASASVAGFMAVIAVSGGVASLAIYLHHRLLSNSITKLQSHIHNSKGGSVKKVRFVDRGEAAEEEYSGNRKSHGDGKSLKGMPLNWQVMYKGRLEYQKFRSCN